jgi:aminoglycoside 3-N-acetyltransferase
MSEQSVIGTTREGPITEDRLVRDLSRLGLQPGAVVLVHSSLSRIGWVSGGAVAVIRALQRAIHAYGTLVMPSHSGSLSDPSLWENPPVPEEWWQTIRETMPAYDPETTPTRGVGAIAELFRTFPDVLRSNHPQVSFTAWGERAVELLTSHSLEDSLGEDSPLARLYDADAQVLLLGAGFDANTSFHLAEYRADFATKERVTLGAPVTIDGHRRWKSFSDINYDAGDFLEIGKSFVKSHKQQVRSGRVGLAQSLLFSQRATVDHAVKWMHTHRR